MPQSQDVSVLIAFCAGFLSFVSPCVLPLVLRTSLILQGLPLRILPTKIPQEIEMDDCVSLDPVYSGLFNRFHCHGGLGFLSREGFEPVSNVDYQNRGALIILLGIHFVLQIFPFLQIEKRIHLRKSLWDM